MRGCLFQAAAALGLCFSLAATPLAAGGDLLRGGASSGAGTSKGNAAPGGNTVVADQVRVNGQDALARTTQALQAMKAMEAAAQRVAPAAVSFAGKTLPGVPNGLSPGGLQLAPGVPANLAKPAAGEDPKLWQGANLPVETTTAGGTVVGIKQTAQQAVLNWQTFNVGSDTTLIFDQSLGGSRRTEWVAFNKVNDPSGVPSQILGAIHADGQVYVINPNGIIFGAGAQLNLHTLTAAALPITDSLLTSGLLNNPKAQFLFSADTVTDPAFTLGGLTTYTLAQRAGASRAPTVTAGAAVLTPGTDYTTTRDAGGQTTIHFTPAGVAKAGAAPIKVSYVQPSGDVVVEEGAVLSSPTTPEHVGGRVALVGANVTNNGTIETPDGQTILAAGLQVGFAAHASSDPSLRGLDVFVGAEDVRTGTAVNSGVITAPRGAVTIAGRTVNQLGAIDSSTSVALNGRIDLLADFDSVSNVRYDPVTSTDPPFFFRQTGQITLGPGSVTQILPELNSTDTVASTALPLRSQVNLQGEVIHLAGGATLLAPNAVVTLQAGLWDASPTPSAPSLFTFTSTDNLSVQPQIYLDSGAMINVAGSANVPVSVEQNILAVEVRGAQLADSPLQRTGVVRGSTLNVDLRLHGPFDPTLNGGLGDYTWVGTPLADARGYRDLIKRGVGELTAAGGTVKLTAGGSVVLQSGSTVDASGGSIEYQGGMVQTTRLLSQGQLLDISQATPDRVYDGVYTGKFEVAHPKYGITDTFTNPLALTGAHFEPTYVQGAAGGSITITAPSMALDGTLLGETVTGLRQRSALPAPSSLALIFQAQDTSTQHPSYSPTPPDLYFRTGLALEPVAPFSVNAAGDPTPLTDERKKRVVLSPDLYDTSGFGNITVDNSDGNISVLTDLNAPPSGSLTLTAANISVQSHVTAPGGKLSFTTFNFTPFFSHVFPPASVPTAPTVDPKRGLFALTSQASLSAAGLVVDDRFEQPGMASLPLVTDGGSVSIKAYSADLATGSTIDVSGGIAVTSAGKRSFGKAGSISILTGLDPNAKSAIGGGTLKLGSTLLGYSGTQGGSLTLQTQLVQIGGFAPQTKMVQIGDLEVPRLDFAGTLVDPSAFLLLSPDFFSQGGFQNFTIRGIGIGTANFAEFLPAVAIEPGTVIAPREQSLVGFTTGAGGRISLIPETLPGAARPAVNLTFQAIGANSFSGAHVIRGDFVMGAGASIQADPLASVSISADTATILGGITAPGGAISIAGQLNSSGLFENDLRARVTVYLGQNAHLSVAGTTVLTVDPRGYHTGSVLPGGTISVSGNIVAESGALLDVSGASDVLDMPPQANPAELADSSAPTPTINPLNGSLHGRPLVATPVASSAGAISLLGGQILFSDATLRGQAGGAGAFGGSLSIASGIFPVPNVPQNALDATLTLTQSGQAIPTGFNAQGAAVGRVVVDLPLKSASGGFLALDSFASGGFDFVNLHGVVRFAGDATLSVGRELHVADGGVILADGAVHLAAPYVALGTVFQAPLTIPQQAQLQTSGLFTGATGPFFFGPSFGKGSLTVEAQQIDIGNLSLQGIGKTVLDAGQGDIRGDGIFDVAGSLTMRAGQVYPATAVSFTIAAYDPNVTVVKSSVGSSAVQLASATLPPGFGVGSPLLGSTVAAINGDAVTLASGANTSVSQATPETFAPGAGSITVVGAGRSELPLSAGGALNLFASNINQGGALVAPGGSIRLGWDGTGASPVDLISGAGLSSATGPLKLASVPIAQTITLSAGSLTSVSLVDPVTGAGVLIPYGLNVNGSQWIDPSGLDITAGGVPQKSITISGLNVADRAGSTVDLRGGGDLYAYRWVPGPGGSKDVLATSGSFAIIPGYSSDFAPYAPFNTNPTTDNFGTGTSIDRGYTNTNLRPGDHITLQGGGSLAAGTYTLLPARYALLPGAYLITPQSGQPLGSFDLPIGSSIVSGMRDGQTVLGRFEVADGSVVRSRSQYEDSYANSFLRLGAQINNAPIPRLPMDAGYLRLQGAESLVVEGTVKAQAPEGALSGVVDVSSRNPNGITIGGSGVAAGQGAGVVISAAELDSFGAGSLLVGGYRDFARDGTATVTVEAPHLTLDNAGTTLAAPEIILVAKKTLTLAPGAELAQVGTQPGQPAPLIIGNAAQPGSGDGALIRVTDGYFADLTRLGRKGATDVQLTIGAGAKVSGTNLTLDSTYGTDLSPLAQFTTQVLSLNSGQISLQFPGAGPLETVNGQPTAGVVLAGPGLSQLQTLRGLSLLSYTSIDLYGAGTLQIGGQLALHASEIRGFGNNGGTVTLGGSSVLLDNRAGAALPAGVDSGAPPLTGTLAFQTGTLTLGAGAVQVAGYGTVALDASNGILLDGKGSLSTAGALVGTPRSITGAAGSDYTIHAGGALTISPPGKTGGGASPGGLGVNLKLEGSSVTANGDILLPSGGITLHATGAGGISVGGRLDVSGSSVSFYDLTKFTDAGNISLVADVGPVDVAATGSLSVAADPAGGNAGALTVVAPGSFTLEGKVFGQGGTLAVPGSPVVQGRGGSFTLDTGSLPSLSVLAPALTFNPVTRTGGFVDTQNIRVRTGNVMIDGLVTAHAFTLSADQGAITVTGSGVVDAQGPTGGTINLVAGGSVILNSGAVLNAEGANFSSAGQGGAISLEAGASTLQGGIYGHSATAVVDLQTGSTLLLGVKSVETPAGALDPMKVAAAAAVGQFTGMLHLRAPQNAGGSDVQINPIAGTVQNASTILVEGYRAYLPPGGAIDAVESAVFTDGKAFAGNSSAILSRIFGGNAPASAVVVPGAEIVNPNGSLTLSGDWNLSTFRFGPRGAPGILTMRAAGDLVFNGALTDGFTPNPFGLPLAYDALSAQNPLLPVNAQSWSYRLAAGADFAAADFHQVQGLGMLAADTGSLLLGQPFTPLQPGSETVTLDALFTNDQVIRTGSGSIDIATGRDVRLLNPFATIYTAGTQIADPSSVKSAGDFDVPNPLELPQSGLGAIQSPYWLPQYSFAGGNVTIHAQGDIKHALADGTPDSERQIPSDWLYRRGQVDANGNFARTQFGDIASTTWWVDFSNFFEGIGTLGGGDVTLRAGGNVTNVDALAATNARMVGKAGGVAVAPDPANLVEMGGGDVTVRAGGSIDAGVYYVERGHGELTAGGSIHTNATRAPSAEVASGGTPQLPSETYLPTTLFLGKGQFDVSAKSDVILGPVVNAFLAPPGVSNSFVYRTYFSTYSEDSAVNISSLGGDIDLRESVTINGATGSMLQQWLSTVALVPPSFRPNVSSYEPWIRLAETSLLPFSTALALHPATVRATAFSGDLNISGKLVLTPAPRGTLDLLAAGAINGLNVIGLAPLSTSTVRVWGSTQIVVSDADPRNVPGIAAPQASASFASPNEPNPAATNPLALALLDSLFAESGSTLGDQAVAQTKLALHDATLLHQGDPLPLHLYAVGGNIADLQLFSPKAARVFAQEDLTDIGIYAQNTSGQDTTVVSAGRDIVAYNPNAPRLQQALSPGNSPSETLARRSPAQTGDIQISGPGTLEVLAGRNIDLGAGRDTRLPADLGIGISSIGNLRNLALPLEGASILVGAGLGAASDLTSSKLDFKDFSQTYLTAPLLDRYLPELGTLPTVGGTAVTSSTFAELSQELQNRLAIQIFYLVLRDSGRNHNLPGSPSFGSYADGFAAIKTLFPASLGTGDIALSSRSVKTSLGGDIDIFAPDGGLTLGFDVPPNGQAPPGVVTEAGGSISIFTDRSVQVGALRIFTLRGGDEIIWSSKGDIAAGNASKTVQTAPPTRVVIDAQSADVQTDLAGLATGGGIGVLATIGGVAPGNVDLIAPVGAVDAGDAGIRATGNLNIAAAQVLNAGNIQVGGVSAGVPAAVSVAAPNLGAIGAANAAQGAQNSAADTAARQSHPQETAEEPDSLISVTVEGYGGGDGESAPAAPASAPAL